MDIKSIEFQTTDVVVAYDSETGDVLHVHQVSEEVVDGKRHSNDRGSLEVERNLVAELARKQFPGRTVKVLTAGPDAKPKPGMRQRVDVRAERVVEEIDPRPRRIIEPAERR